jgi:xanthine/uracil/vitamin C permease (AzgA family)
VLDRLFHLTANRTTVRPEIVAGITTFLAMAYIIFVQPAVLSAAGMDSLVLYPIVAPALILVGALMMTGVREISVDRSHRGDSRVPDDGDDAADREHHRRHRVRVHRLCGAEACTGRGREAHALVYGCAALFVARYVWLM